MYRDIILKLDGLDDFQQVRGFLRGLNPDIQRNVESKDPKTLEEAIKQAHIYADPSDEHDTDKTQHSSYHTQPFHNSFKRKTLHGTTTDTQESTKKSKSSRGPLSPEEFERAKREHLCFLCLGTHPKKDCPKLKTAGPNGSLS